MTRMSYLRLFARATPILLWVVCPLWSQTNLLINGDFSQGNIGFRSDYTYSSTDCTLGGYYSIGTNPFSCNGSAPSFGDHTTGTGLMMIVNGAVNPGVVAWEETVSVLPGKNYFFRGWVADWGNDNGPQEPARLMVIINGSTISTVIPDTRDGYWIPFNVQWDSQSSTSAKIEIVDADLAWYQNDFALDDLYFAIGPPPPITQRYAQVNLVSDIPGLAAFTDKKLINPWGVAFGPTSPFWVADNGTGLSTLYAKDGTPISQLPSIRIPPPHGSTAKATPTGMVFNPTTDFVVSANGNSGPAIFLFATEDGTISGWNPTVALRRAVLAVDNSQIGAVYKGLAFGHTSQGNFIYATNFHDGSVEMYDTNFQLVKTFTDIGLPPGYAPFGIRTIAGKLYVTFAKQDADKHDDVPGTGHGFVDVFNFQGRMLQRLVSRNRLNSPWGVALAPANFGGFSGALLVGNFGDGKINAFDPKSGAFLGVLRDLQGHILAIDGLWTITFGNGGSTGPRNALFFSAGPNHESDGLFGVLTLIP